MVSEPWSYTCHVSRMDVISYRKIQDELAHACQLDPDSSAIILEIGSGELVAFVGKDLSHGEASGVASAFYVIWKAQFNTAESHDDKLEVIFLPLFCI